MLRFLLMEHTTIHTTDSIWSLPREINEEIFRLVSVADLCHLWTVCKSVHASLRNQRIWRDACKKDFDLEFIDDNSDWIKLGARYCAINTNIHKARVLVSALAVTRLNNNRLFIGDSFLRDDDRVVINWLRTTGRGSGAVDDSDHSSIVNLKTRKEEQRMKLNNDRSLTMIGDRLVELEWESYSARIRFSNMKIHNQMESDSALDEFIPISGTGVVILSNQDPSRKHIVLIIERELNDYEKRVLKIYDLKARRTLKTINGVTCFTDYMSHNFVLRGDFIYYLLEKDVLRVINWTSEVQEGDQIHIPFVSKSAETQGLLGAHNSRVFGYGSEKYLSGAFLWMFDFRSKTFQMYEGSGLKQTNDMIVHCGVLVVVSGQIVHFMDYRSDPTKLNVISLLQTDEIYRTSLESMKDGRLFLSGHNSGAKLLDFEHANDDCEILFVQSADGEQKSNRIPIKAFELVSRANSLLGTYEYVSRYFKKGSERRFGIIYRKNVDKTADKLNLGNFFSKTPTHPEYNTPYMYYKTMYEISEKDPQRIVWAIGAVEKSFFGSAIIFYEEWTGTQWKLSKPTAWITEM